MVVFNFSYRDPSAPSITKRTARIMPRTLYRVPGTAAHELETAEAFLAPAVLLSPLSFPHLQVAGAAALVLRQRANRWLDAAAGGISPSIRCAPSSNSPSPSSSGFRFGPVSAQAVRWAKLPEASGFIPAFRFPRRRDRIAWPDGVSSWDFGWGVALRRLLHLYLSVPQVHGQIRCCAGLWSLEPILRLKVAAAAPGGHHELRLPREQGRHRGRWLPGVRPRAPRHGECPSAQPMMHFC